MGSRTRIQACEPWVRGHPAFYGLTDAYTGL
jgi:hypothetical protein